MNDWLSFLLLGSGVIGLSAIFFINRHARMAQLNKKTNQLQDKINQILYFDNPVDVALEEASAFSPKELITFFESLFSHYRNREDIVNKLCDLFKRLHLEKFVMESFEKASVEEKMLWIEECKSLPVPEIIEFLQNILYKKNPERIILKIGETLAVHKRIDALPLFLLQTLHIPTDYNEEIAETIRSFQGDFPGFFLDKQDPRYRELDIKIEARYISFLDSPQQKIVAAGLYVLGALGLESSLSRIIQSIKTPLGRSNLHIACTALKQCNHDQFLSSLLIWIMSIENWTSDEIQDLISVFSRFYPAGERFIDQLHSHPQLIVQVFSKAASTQNQE